MCQKAFGSFFAPLVGVPLTEFELTRGELAIFKSSDLIERGFCRDCGTPLTFHDVDGDRIDVSIGSLDEPEAVEPVIQFGIGVAAALVRRARRSARRARRRRTIRPELAAADRARPIISIPITTRQTWPPAGQAR